MSLEIFLIGLLCSNFIVILKDCENPYKSLLLTKNPVGIPYSLRKAKNPYCGSLVGYESELYINKTETFSFVVFNKTSLRYRKGFYYT